MRQARAVRPPCGIDQPNLQASRLAGRDEIGDANDAAGLAIAANGNPDTGDGEAVARGQRGFGHPSMEGFLSFGAASSCSKATSAVARWALIAFMSNEGWNATFLVSRSSGCLSASIFEEFVDRAGLHAMRRRQHQVGRDQAAGAEGAARADNGDDGAADALGR